jgi:hypothetical protein
MQVLEKAVGETTQTWEQDGIAHGVGREIIGGGDETCLQHMMLVFQALSTGFLLCAHVADDRTSPTWKAAGEKRLMALGTTVRDMVRERASALIQLAEQGLACLSLPDCLHLMHDIVKSYSFPLAQQLRQAHNALTHVETVLARPAGLPPPGPNGPEALTQGEVHRAKVPPWQEAPRLYRQHLVFKAFPA